MFNWKKITSLEFTLLLLLWFIATAYNLNKAFHIDDTAHLETALWIAENPTTPMSGLVNWNNNAEPIHLLNQPHLYFYLIAVWGKFFGYDEISMHVLQSFFVLAAIIFFFKLAKIQAPLSASLLTILFTLAPAFFVGQNMMVDIPILSLWLGFYFFLLTPESQSEHKRYIYAAIFSSAAILIKYSSVTLLPVLLIHIIIRRQYKCLYAFLIPIVLLLGWSYFNYLDYGSVHILDRPMQSITIDDLVIKAKSWLITLGSVSPFSVLFLPNAFSSFSKLLRLRGGNKYYCLFLIIIVLYLTIFIKKVFFQDFEDLSFVFFINGLFLFLLCIQVVAIFTMKFIAREKTALFKSITPSDIRDIVLYYWLFSSVAFIILFVPFMATRHVLLTIPAMLFILGSKLQARWSSKIVLASVFTTIFITTNLAIADWQFANYYRQQAIDITKLLPKDSVIWFTGHWGWQWYAKQYGMKQLNSLNPSAMIGDYLVYPTQIDQQTMNPRLILKPVMELHGHSINNTFLSTAGGFASFYVSSTMPWSLNEKPLGDIIIYKVIGNNHTKNSYDKSFKQSYHNLSTQSRNVPSSPK